MSEKLLPCPFCGGEPKLMQAWVECKKCRAMTAVSGTQNEAISAWNRRPVAKKTKVENLKHLLDLVSLNPDLPVLPIVDADCVASDDYGYWLASIGSVEVTKILDDINYCTDGKFYREDDFDEIVEDLVSESDDPLDEEEAEAIVRNYPWRKAILVYIIPG